MACKRRSRMKCRDLVLITRAMQTGMGGSSTISSTWSAGSSGAHSGERFTRAFQEHASARFLILPPRRPLPAPKTQALTCNDGDLFVRIASDPANLIDDGHGPGCPKFIKKSCKKVRKKVEAAGKVAQKVASTTGCSVAKTGAATPIGRQHASISSLEPARSQKKADDRLGILDLAGDDRLPGRPESQPL